MRVALIDPSLFTLPYDGALACGLQANGHEVSLHGRPVLPEDGDSGGIAVIPSFYRLSARAKLLPKPLLLALKGVDHGVSLLGLLRRLRRARPDVIHFQWLPLPGLDRTLLARFRRLAPVVLTVHDTDPFNGNPTARLQRLGFVAALRACDRLIVHTQQGVTRLRAMGIPAEKIAVVPPGLFAPDHTRARQAADTALTFVLFGKIKPYKGADLLIDAFGLLPEALRRQARIRIIGKSYMDLDALHARLRHHGIEDRVTIEDRFVADDEIAGVFGPGTVAAFPYREIEASGVLGLATIYGRPIIASRIGLFAEGLTDGVHGHVVPCEDVPALADAMAHMITDPAFTRSCAGAVAALAQASPGWTEVGRLTACVYADVLRHGAAQAPAQTRQWAEGLAS